MNPLLDPCSWVEDREELERRMGGVYALDGTFGSLWALERILVGLRRMPRLAPQARWMVPYLGDFFERAFEEMGMPVLRMGPGALRVSAPIAYEFDVAEDLQRMIGLGEPFPHFHGLRWIENNMLGSAMLPWYGLSTIFQNHAWAKTEHDAIGRQRDRMDRAVPWLTRAYVAALNLPPEHTELALKAARAMVWPPLCYAQNDYGEHNRGRLIGVLEDAEPQQIRDILDAFVASQDHAVQKLAAITAIHFGVPPDNRHEACVYRDAITCFHVTNPPPFIVRSINKYGASLETSPRDTDLEDYGTLYQLEPAKGLLFGREMIARDDTLPATQCTTGWHAERLGREADALAHYARAIELKADYAQPFINRGALQSMREDYVRGDQDFFAAFALRPEDPDIPVNLLLNHLFAKEAASASPAPVVEEVGPMRALLKRYGRKEIDQNGAIRALVTYQDYLVPSFLMPPEHVSSKGIVFSQKQDFPGGALWVFTDEAAAYRAQAQHAELGAYTCGQPSSVFLTRLVQSSFANVRINPMGPEEEGFILLPKALDLLNLWADGVRVEQAAESGDLNALSASIRQHRGLMVALRNGQLFLANGAQGPVAYVAATLDRSQALNMLFGKEVTMAPVPAPNVRAALAQAQVKYVRIGGVDGDFPASIFG